MTPATARMGPAAFQALRRDRIAVATLVVWVIGALPYALTADRAWLTVYERVGLYPPLLGLIVIACLHGLRRVESERERQFWALLGTAFAAWLASYVPYWVVPEPWPLAVDFAGEVFYLLFYVCLLLAVDARPCLATSNPMADAERWLRSLGAVLTAFAAALYFVVVPAVVKPSDYSTQLPSLLLYLALDAFVLLRVIAALVRCRSPRWRVLYSALGIATALMLAVDTLEYLGSANVLPLEDGRPNDLVWTIPLVAYAIAARMGRLPLGSPPAIPFLEAIDLSPTRTGSFLVLCAIGAPIVHMGLYLGNLLDAAERRPRQAIVLGTVVVLGGLAVTAYRVLERERLALKTRQHRLEGQLRQSERTQTLSEVAHGVAQYLNNLLQIVAGRSEALLRSLPSDNPLGEDVRAIKAATQQIATFSSQLMDLVQMEFETPELLRLSDVVHKFEGFLRAVVTGQVRMETRYRATRDLVRADPRRIERVLISLAGNARDAMPRGGTLVIEIFDVEVSPRRELDLGLVAGPYAAVSFTDDGPGMSEEAQRMAFRPFFTTKADRNRPGLGLTHALRVASYYGGTVHLESELGRGTTATLYLPRLEERVIDTAEGSIEHTLRVHASDRLPD